MWQVLSTQTVYYFPNSMCFLFLLLTKKLKGIYFSTFYYYIVFLLILILLLVLSVLLLLLLTQNYSNIESLKFGQNSGSPFAFTLMSTLLENSSNRGKGSKLFSRLLIIQTTAPRLKAIKTRDRLLTWIWVDILFNYWVIPKPLVKYNL